MVGRSRASSWRLASAHLAYDHIVGCIMNTNSSDQVIININSSSGIRLLRSRLKDQGYSEARPFMLVNGEFAVVSAKERRGPRKGCKAWAIGVRARDGDDLTWLTDQYAGHWFRS